MKIHIPYASRQTIGGGYTFYNNFIKALTLYYPGIEIVGEDQQHDILFAFSATTVQGETIERSKQSGAKFILRMDGVPEDSRNSGHGTRRLVEYSHKADGIIYQTAFIRDTLGMILKNNGVIVPHTVIRNGVDTDIFKPDGEKIGFHGKPNILHIAYRKDNNKRYEEVLAMYREYFMSNKEANLLLLGRYPTEWQDYNMGFFNGERYQRLGVVEDIKVKAMMIRSADLLFYPSFADPAPNVVLEAIASGVPVLYNAYGGVNEMVGYGGKSICYEKSYTEQIEDMLNNLSVYKENALKAALNHTLRKMVDDYTYFFGMALSA